MSNKLPPYKQRPHSESESEMLRYLKDPENLENLRKTDPSEYKKLVEALGIPIYSEIQELKKRVITFTRVNILAIASLILDIIFRCFGG